MKITNRLNLPEPLVRAVTFDPYDKGDCDFSVTELIKPARARKLLIDHFDEREEDASDRLWALMGQIGHLILERAALAGMDNIVERRFYYPVLANNNSWVVGGMADLIMLTPHMANLVDYKFCSLWAVKDGVEPDWEAQMNLLAYLAEHNGVQISTQNIVAVFRDWSKPRSHREKDYPKEQIRVVPVPVWSDYRKERFIKERILAHLAAEQELPLCTDEERWATKDTWALMKKGHKRASKLFNNETAANHALSFIAGGYVEHRGKEYKRCADYCAAYPFCTQAQETKTNDLPAVLPDEASVL